LKTCCVLYRGEKIVTVIDGLDAVDCCYAFAGAVGADVRRFTLRQLCKMADGRMRASRLESLQLAQLVWSIGDIDLPKFLLYGDFAKEEENDLDLSPELQERIRLEIQRIRKDNPNIPIMVGGNGGTS